MNFKAGDLAISQVSNAPHWNDGHLVLVIEVLPAGDAPNVPEGYVIRRIDGQNFGWTLGVDNTPHFFEYDICWCEKRHLRKPDESLNTTESVCVCEGV